MKIKKIGKAPTPTYSFVVPIYNDGSLAPAFCSEFQDVFCKILGRRKIRDKIELIFVNDGSLDNSSEALNRLARTFPFVRVVHLSRNFGQHLALTCGYRFARKRVVGMMNVDLQEHPDQIPLLIQRMSTEKCDIVFGLRKKRSGSKLDALTSWVFAILLNKLTGYETPLNVATLRIMSRRFVDAYNNLRESNRYLPGLEQWLGFKKGYVEICHQGRSQGKSSYTFLKRLSMAFEAIISFSDLPLRIAVALGFGVVFAGFFLTLALIAQKLFFVDVQLGYTSTICLIISLAGVQLVVVGLASLYIGRILREVQKRPVYVIKNTINIEEDFS